VEDQSNDLQVVSMAPAGCPRLAVQRPPAGGEAMDQQRECNMPEYNNGHDAVELDELAGRDAQRIAARNPLPGLTQSQRVIEPSSNKEPPSQSSHDKMLDAVDRIADQWIAQLEAVRVNTQIIEQMVLTAVNKVKHDLTELQLLGAAVTQEAKRGEEVCHQLTGKIKQVLEGRAP
jgi:hypothetical protein